MHIKANTHSTAEAKVQHKYMKNKINEKQHAVRYDTHNGSRFTNKHMFKTHSPKY